MAGVFCINSLDDLCSKFFVSVMNMALCIICCGQEVKKMLECFMFCALIALLIIFFIKIHNHNHCRYNSVICNLALCPFLFNGPMYMLLEIPQKSLSN